MKTMVTVMDLEADLNRLEPLSEHDQQKWLVVHIPYRVRAVLPGIHMPGKWNTDWIGKINDDEVIDHCMADAIWEGRLASMRWLIFFVGIQATKKSQEKAHRPSIHSREHDTFITRFAGGEGQLFPFGPEADRLAAVWSGCSKATAHPTNGTKHPRADEPELVDALTLIITHLERTIYRHSKKDLWELTRIPRAT